MPSKNTIVRFRARTGARSLAALMAATTIAACTELHPTMSRLPIDGRVRVEFAEPTLVSVQTAAPDRIPFAGVTRLDGRVEIVTEDTVYVRVKGASGPDLKFRDVPVNGIAAVPRRPETHFSRVEFSGFRTTMLALGTAGAVVASALVYIIWFAPPFPG